MAKFYVFCTPTNSGDIYTKGISVPCRKCGEMVWLSDTTVEGIKNRHGIKSFDEQGGIYPFCEDHQNDKGMEGDMMPLTKEQIEELNGLDRKN